MASPFFLAVDLGAETGRTVLGTLEQDKLRMEEVHRFPNDMLYLHGHWHWNVYRLFESIREGLARASKKQQGSLRSMAIDTWGVDFGLLTHDGTLLGLPVTYRDPRTQGAMEQFFKQIPREKVYLLTGNQFLRFNTLFQLFAMKQAESPLLNMADSLLFMPDIFNFMLTGEKKTEFTYATTSQLLNPRKGEWEKELFKALGLSTTLMQEIVAPGTPLGELDQAICKETDLPDLQVIATASHDTGAAVAAVPAEDEDFAYISCGTWSLMGIETLKPIVNKKALALNFTNEGGVEGTFRFLKNITGLWLLQQCRKEWNRDRSISYDALEGMASAAAPFKALFDPDRGEFLNPPVMTRAIARSCKKKGQPPPETPGEFTRAILESLALKYRFTLEQLRSISPHPIRRIHIIGGGARNRLLCQFTADACGLPVWAGPEEATAAGNIMVQAMALGYLSSLKEARMMIRRSVSLEEYEPCHDGHWDGAYDRFLEIMDQ